MVKAKSNQVADLICEIVDWAFRLSPTTGTVQGYSRYNDVLGRFTEDSVTTAVKEAKRFERQLSDILDRDSLHDEDEADVIVCRAYVRDIIGQGEMSRGWRRDPFLHVESFVFGCYALTVAFNLDEKHRFECLCSRLALIPELLDEARVSLTEPCRPMVEAALDSLPKMGGLFQVIGDDLARADGDRQRLTSLRNDALSAINKYTDWLREELLPAGAEHVSIGQKSYEFMVQETHLLPYSGAELLAIGEQLVDRIQSRMNQLATEIEPGSDWQQVMKTADRGMPTGDLLDLYRQNVSDLVQFCQDKKIVTLPDDDLLLVEETPNFVRSFIPYAAYLPCGMFSERDLPGRFFVTCPDPDLPAEHRHRLLAAHNDCSRILTSLHEGYPGHHLQLTLARKVGTDARRLSQSTTFVEGWAFYCEQMMIEQEFVTQPLQVLTMMQGELWRAARVVIDSSYHCRSMTVAMAQKYLQDRVGMQPEHALAEARWYARRPSYPMTYMMGKQELLKLRDKFMASGRSLGEFHDRLLATAGLPPALAAREIYV